MIADSPEYSKGSTTPFHVVELWREPGLAIGFLLLFFFRGINLSSVEMIHSEISEAFLDALFLKNTEKGATAM